jgi:mannitol-1-phosphate 5-dehydrogenase
VFVDVSQNLLNAINSRREYAIEIVGASPDRALVSNVRAVDGRDSAAVAREIANCSVACTAVGAGALRYVAPNLAAGLLRRHREGGGPLNVLICENLHGANHILKDLVADCLPEVERDAILAKTGFVQAVVSRMVPLQKSDGDPLAVRVEAYKLLTIDGRALVGNLPDISGVQPVDNFVAYEDRKLYTHNCAHATLGYLGCERGIELACDALKNPEVSGILRGVLHETSKALVKKHGFDPAVQNAHVEDLLQRFANRDLGDTCFRLARDPLRKLAPEDRLVGAARLCEELGVETGYLSEVIGSALRFNSPDDSSSVELQARIASTGVETVVKEVCGIRPDEPLGIQVLNAYREAVA